MTYKPPTFADLQNPKCVLKRSPRNQDLYNQKIDFIKNILKKTPEKYIVDHIIGDKIGYILVPNQYPYWMDGVYHYVLWTSWQTLNACDVKRYMKKNYPDVEYIKLKNPKQKKSVHIDHYHIFTKTKLI